MKAFLSGVAVCSGLLLGAVVRDATSQPLDSPDPSRLALIVVEDPGPGTLPDLLDRGLLVIWNGGDFLLAAVDEGGRETLTRRGLSWTLLDGSISGKTYWVASPVHAADEARLASRTRVLRLARGVAVVETSPARIGDVLDLGLHAARVFLEPIRPFRVRESSLARGEGPSPIIEAIVDSVSGARVDAGVQRLQDFVTRYSFTDSCQAAAEWMASEFTSFGIDSVTFHEWNASHAPNVVAVIPGSILPDEIIVAGGHFDSYAAGNPNNSAPGADDNASGTSLVIECARVLSQYEFVRTLVFIAFSGEEEGLLGSHAWANQADAQGLDIVAMLNADMVGYTAPGDQLDLSIISENNYPDLRDLLFSVGADYVPQLVLENGYIPGGSSDHQSFWQVGYHAIMFFEDSQQSTPYIHTTSDLVGMSYNSPPLAYRSAQLGAAFLATLAEPLRLAISHVPLPDTENTTDPYRVVATIISPSALDPDSTFVRYSGGVDWEMAPLTPTGAPREYEAFIPAHAGGSVVSYYLVAGDEEGNRATHPGNAPAEVHDFFVGAMTVVFADDFEDDRGWTTRRPGDDAEGGIWQREDPNGTWSTPGEIQPEDDHSEPPGTHCFVTGNAPRGTPIGENDVDGGRTTLESPMIALADLAPYANARLRYQRWFANSSGAASGTDELVVEASADSGATWVELERVGTNQRRWVGVELELSDFVDLTNGFALRFVASDLGTEDIVEGAVDDVSITSYEDGSTPVDPGGPGESPEIVAGALRQVMPNPYAAGEAIRFGVPAPGRRAWVRIFDTAGREVATLVDGDRVAGFRTVRWDGRDARRRAMPAGVYFFRLRAGDDVLVRKFLLVH